VPSWAVVGTPGAAVVGTPGAAVVGTPGAAGAFLVPSGWIKPTVDRVVEATRSERWIVVVR
jgi:hypothetical protein